jgi:hypothetical protein
MQRRVGLAVVVAVVVVVVVVLGALRLHGSGPPPRGAPGSGAAHAAVAVAPRPRVDPRALARASIAGTVRDEAGAAIARARVCGDAWSDELPHSATAAPTCADTDERSRSAPGAAPRSPSSSPRRSAHAEIGHGASRRPPCQLLWRPSQ